MKTRFILLITVFFVCCVFSFVKTCFTRFNSVETYGFQAALAIQNDLKTE